MTRTIKNTFLIFWTAAVLFICIGSLINFHQHKIWGKALLPQLLYAKRDKEQSANLLTSFAPGTIHTPDHSKIIDYTAIQDQPSILIALFSWNHITDAFFVIPDKQQLPSAPLRAPPVA